MRDSELVARAQLAASALEGAWQRWRVVHDAAADPMSAVSSYVGYSLQEPWGQPRVVFGLTAEDAEHLAALIERHDRGDKAYRVMSAQAPVPEPRQAPLAAATTLAGQPLADALLSSDHPDYYGPVYRQAAAAVKEAAAARENAGPATPEGAERTDLISPEWMGALAKAASTARAEAEARIRATLNELDDEPADAQASTDADERRVAADGQDADADRDCGIDDHEVADEGIEPDDSGALAGDESTAAEPRIFATDVLEPLPRPEDVEEPASAPTRDDQGEGEQDEDDDAGDRVDDPPEQDDHEVVPSGQSGGLDSGITRRGRVNRGHPVARLSKTKRPGASSQPAGD